MRVLIVGPDTWVRRYVQQLMVRECGHAVTAVTDPDVAVRALHTVEWDALVTEVRIRDDVWQAMEQEGAPRWEPEMRVRMIRGTLEELLRCPSGMLPVKAELVRDRTSGFRWGISA